MAEQAIEGSEFLTSFDEGFRPVNLYNGPDGNLYVVDMHRGVIQHYAFLSPYLRKKAKAKQLDTTVNLGRILKIRDKNSVGDVIPDLEALTLKQLVGILKHKNGWLRDKAQQFIIHKKKEDAIPELKNLVKDQQWPLAQMHALCQRCKWLKGAATFCPIIK